MARGESRLSTPLPAAAPVANDACNRSPPVGGVETPAEAIALARRVAASTGLTCDGFMLYPDQLR
jgi:hypothetical protein